MITREELRRTVVLGRLTDAMLDKVLPLAERKRYDAREAIFREGDAVEDFYILAEGKVLLEKHLSEKITVSVDSIKPGYPFGWSNMLAAGLAAYSAYTYEAICAEPSTVYVVDGDAFHSLLEGDTALGYLVTCRLNQVLEQRLVHRTEQFLRLIRKHPDIHNLIA